MVEMVVVMVEGIWKARKRGVGRNVEGEEGRYVQGVACARMCTCVHAFVNTKKCLWRKRIIAAIIHAPPTKSQHNACDTTITINYVTHQSSHYLLLELEAAYFVVVLLGLFGALGVLFHLLQIVRFLRWVVACVSGTSKCVVAYRTHVLPPLPSPHLPTMHGDSLY